MNIDPASPEFKAEFRALWRKEMTAYLREKGIDDPELTTDRIEARMELIVHRNGWRDLTEFPKDQPVCVCEEPKPVPSIEEGRIEYPTDAWLRCIKCKGLFR